MLGYAHDIKWYCANANFFYEIRVKIFKALLMFKHSRNNTFSLNDTLCLELKGTAKLLGVVFHTSFLSRFKAIIPLRTTVCRTYCLDLLNKEQFGYFEPLYQGNCCKSMAFWRQRLEIAPIISKKAFVSSCFVLLVDSRGKVATFAVSIHKRTFL